MSVQLRSLIPAYAEDVETRARCQDDGHPVGAVHPYWFGPGQPGSVCHCGRIAREGVLPVDQWPRPNSRPRAKPRWGHDYSDSGETR